MSTDALCQIFNVWGYTVLEVVAQGEKNVLTVSQKPKSLPVPSQHQAYGFRDIESFKLKSYALHEANLELVE